MLVSIETYEGLQNEMSYLTTRLTRNPWLARSMLARMEMDTLATLAKLGIDREDHRVLSLLPLVQIAWADGAIQLAERSLIVRTAYEMGWLAGGGAAVLERWLASPPTEEEVAIGTELLELLARTEGDLADQYTGDHLRHLLLLCEDVGRAAGQLFGLRDGRNAAELRALETIAQALDVKNAKGWRRDK